MIKDKTRLQQCFFVNLDHALSVWDYPDTSESFVTVIIFITSRVDTNFVSVYVADNQSGPCNTYERTLFARDSARRFRVRTTAGQKESQRQISFLSSVLVCLETLLKSIYLKDGDKNKSKGHMCLGQDLEVEKIISNILPLKVSTDFTICLLVKIRCSNVDRYG